MNLASRGVKIVALALIAAIGVFLSISSETCAQEKKARDKNRGAKQDSRPAKEKKSKTLDVKKNAEKAVEKTTVPAEPETQPEAGSIMGFVKESAAGTSEINMVKFLSRSMELMAARYAEDTVEMNISGSYKNAGLDEMKFFYIKRYKAPISLKADYVSKYAAKDYFTFESDVVGYRGYQIISKESAKNYIDMAAYKVSTDSVFIACVTPASAGSKPKLMAEPHFFRRAVMAAREFESKQSFSFYDISLLSVFKPEKGREKLLSCSALGTLKYQNLMVIYSYIDQKSASDAFKTFALTKSEAVVLTQTRKKDAEYEYYLSPGRILAVSNKLK